MLPVPGVDAQAMLLLLNAARAARSAIADSALIWIGRVARRSSERLIELVDELDARVAFAAATGDLERVPRRPRLPAVEGDLRGRHPRRGVVGRVRAPHSIRAGARRRRAGAPLVNVEHCRHDLGRAPTRREVVSRVLAPDRAAWLQRGARHAATKRRADERSARAEPVSVSEMRTTPSTSPAAPWADHGAGGHRRRDLARGVRGAVEGAGGAGRRRDGRRTSKSIRRDRRRLHRPEAPGGSPQGTDRSRASVRERTCDT